MKDWNDRKINFAKSKEGVIVVPHPFDNLISANYIPWPPPEIVQKLYKSRQIRAFQGTQSSICTSGLTYYCDLQSLHSEDAITWSVFGTVAYSSLSERENWASQFFKLLDISDAVSTNAAIFLWRRIPHPDTLVSGGPEIDFGIITDNTLILGEAKWQSGVGSAQGKKKNKDQIQLRGEFLKKYGKKIFHYKKVQIVVGVGLYKNSFNNTVPTGVRFLSTTWGDICSIQAHPLFDEIQRYYKWKLDYKRK